MSRSRISSAPRRASGKTEQAGPARSTASGTRVTDAASVAVAAVLALTQAGLAQDQSKIAAGEQVYNTYCSTCHGDNLISSGQVFDLRRLTAGDRARFGNSVLTGKNQMPPWKGVLADEQIEQLWQYIRANAVQK